MLLISLNFLHSPSTFSVCSIVSNNVKKCTMCGVQLLFSLLLCTLNLYYTMLIVLNKFNSIQFNSMVARRHHHFYQLPVAIELNINNSPCHLESSRIRPLATAVAAPLHPSLSLPTHLMLLMVAPLKYPFSVSSHLCLGLPLFLARSIHSPEHHVIFHPSCSHHVSKVA